MQSYIKKVFFGNVVEFFVIFANRMSYKITLYTKGAKLPEISTDNFFHSPELFHIIENSPGQRPYMAVTTDNNGTIVAHMLAFIRRRKSLFPPYLYTQGRFYGEGVYSEDVNKEEVFGMMLHKMTKKLRRKMCLFIEFSDLSRKMFGYRFFRREGYFPLNWQEVHNSLHSMPPEQRLSKKMRGRIKHIYSLGVETREAKTEEEVHLFYKMLNGFYRLKLRRLIPHEDHIKQLFKSDNGRIFITVFKHKVIGGCVCVFSEGNAYLWYLASRRKRYPLLRPNMMTVWNAINWSWKHNYAHIFFLDVGLPFHKNPFRDFILSFGGKPVGKYRWFRFNISWLNKLLSYIYRE